MENENLNPNTENIEAVATTEAAEQPATPDAPETTVNNIFPDISADDMSALSEEEKDLYNDIKDMPESMISIMPPEVREEIRALQDKLSGSSAETATAEEPKAEAEATEAPAEEAQKADTAETKSVTAEDAPTEMTEAQRTDEIIRRLTEENRKLQARYDTLQGKYNAEVKKPKESASANADNGGDDSADTPAVDDDAYAEELGLDADIIRAIRRVVKDTNVGNAGKDDSALSAQVAELYTNRQNSLLDAAIREKCGEKIGLHEVGTHPLLPGYAAEMYDDTGKTAWDAIAEAKAKNDHAAAAGIIAQVVKVMEKDGMWNLMSRHSATAEPANAPAAQTPSSAETVKESAVTTPKVSAVTPHNASGVMNSALHTGRTAAQAEAEYAELEKRFRKGDSTVLPRLEKLDDEITRLRIKERLKP